MNTTEQVQSSETDVAEESGATPPTRHHRIVVVGGGTGGIAVASKLCRKLRDPDIAIVEPSEWHYFQPQWTLVGGGVVEKEATRRRQEAITPRKAEWIREACTGFDPESNQIVLAGGGRVGYDYLVVAPGIQLNWTQVRGLTPDLIGKDGICSNYLYDTCDLTWRTLQEFKGGTAVFTMPATPIKCAGAPQKIAYLADDHFRRRGVRDGSRIVYATGTPGIFSVKEFAATLNKVIERKGIEAMFKHDLVEVRAGEKQAVFENLDSGEEVVLDYDMIHITPPQGPPDFVKSSPLANEAGWVDVDKNSLQHVRYPNVFSLGDASSCPTSKTGAAVRKETPVLVHNLLATMRGEDGSRFASYNGYAGCPLVTGYGKLVFAEFDYDLKPTPSFPFDTTKERWTMYQVKKRGLPFLYWNLMTKGR
ncbi:MAG TPA: FAD/NAD(P)-binding oxidoreductase [Gaiellaceae bacterium]|jgi:sulfide:quinone oxidoreductase|nr:FAD/NAD(P)-binding oxidoreductase [Gaiellaceae bacterium]